MGSYTSELAILKLMLDTYAGDISLKFQKESGGPIISLGSTANSNKNHDGGSIILVNPDEFDPKTELNLEKHFLDKEAESQSHVHYWKPLPEARARTLAAIQAENAEIDKVLEPERRGRSTVVKEKLHGRFVEFKTLREATNVVMNTMVLPETYPNE